MAEQRQDRRVRRSKAQLRQALIQLLQESRWRRSLSGS